MKKKGSTSDFKVERDKELLEAFKSQLHLLGQIETGKLFVRASEMPASRFWVSEQRAGVVLSKLQRGDKLEGMNPKRREMFLEIYHRVQDLMRDNPGMKRTEAIFRVVNSRAPQFYLTPKSSRAIIYILRAI